MRSSGAEAPHAPTTGRLSRLLGPFHVTGPFWYRLHLFGMKILPWWMVGLVIHLFTAFFFCTLIRIRRAIASNLDAAIGPADWWERQRRIHRTMLALAWSLSERYEWLAGKTRTDAEVDNLAAWRAVAGTDRGLIVVTAHVGNWEIGSALPARRERRRIHLVREEELDPRAQRFIRQLLSRQTDDRYTTHFATGDPRLGILLREALERGDVVALQGDRPRAGGKVLEVSLFGRPFRVPVGPFALARVAEVPLLPVFMLREGRTRYRVHFRQPIRVARSSDRERDHRSAAERFAAEIEWAISAAPHQWFCFNELWPGSPTGRPARSRRTC
ncbi:MAG TPA: lysophospholipid acyltransferase family protein [Candidatus Polarisedimenticolaceae bacterium]|nr:lysophospholipid acyltransferase family protein [Candidatus Polarisedimenticolaceae bacterium]